MAAPPPPMPVEPAFEEALAREILVSERLRVTLLAAVAAAGFLAYCLVFLLFPAIEDRMVRGHVGLGAFSLVLGPALGYFLLARGVFGYYLKRQRHPPVLVHYGGVVIETSIPTALLLLWAHAVGGELALLSPPAFVYYLFIILATLRLNFWLCLFTGASSAFQYLAVALAVLSLGEIGTPALGEAGPAFFLAKTLLLLAGGLTAGLVAARIRKQFINSLQTHQQCSRVIEVFGKHVSPEVVNQLLTQKVELGGEVRHVCVMFLDIRDFTKYASGKPPEVVVQYLNTLFEFMIACVNRHHGIVNKFLGDGFMAVFGAPLSDGRDSQNAAAAALDIVAQLDELNAAGTIPPTRVGIGLHAGPAVAGTMGSSQRKEYTIIGDTVNLASRIEQLNKQFGSQVLLSEEVRRELQGVREATPLGPVPVKGKDTPVQVYQLA